MTNGSSNTFSAKANLPDPPIERSVDLRSFRWMPVDIDRLRSSEMMVTGAEEVRWYRFNLMCVAWHQVPAGSLPNNDRMISFLLGLGSDLRKWRRLRDDALGEFILCNDGRFYHPVVCEMAKAASAKKNNAKKAAIARWDKDKSLKTNKSPDAAALLREERSKKEQIGHKLSRESTSSDVTARGHMDDECFDCDRAIEIFNSAAERAKPTPLPRCEKLTSERKSKLRARLKDIGGIEGWKAAIEKALASDFLMGRVRRDSAHRNWKLDIDFILNEAKFTKLMEGAYDNRDVEKINTRQRREAILEGLGLIGDQVECSWSN